MIRILLIPIVFLVFSWPLHAAQVIREYELGSYNNILSERQTKAFLLVFWSLDCPPCYQELATLQTLLIKHPDLDLVLVSTDAVSESNEIQRVLDKNRLTRVDAWVFSDAVSQHLRYEVDSSWYGELPRSYLFDARHQRQTVTGIMQPAILESWLANNLKHPH
jgi:thiol-disulfide isomerase/thioredoxin